MRCDKTSHSFTGLKSLKALNSPSNHHHYYYYFTHLSLSQWKSQSWHQISPGTGLRPQRAGCPARGFDIVCMPSASCALCMMKLKQPEDQQPHMCFWAAYSCLSLRSSCSCSGVKTATLPVRLCVSSASLRCLVVPATAVIYFCLYAWASVMLRVLCIYKLCLNSNSSEILKDLAGLRCSVWLTALVSGVLWWTIVIFNDATRGHASALMSSFTAGAGGIWGACRVHFHHDLPLLTALFLPVFSFPPVLHGGPDDDSGAAPLWVQTARRLNRPLRFHVWLFVFSGRAILTQITRTRTWGTGIPTRSWNRHVSTSALLSTSDPEKPANPNVFVP